MKKAGINMVGRIKGETRKTGMSRKKVVRIVMDKVEMSRVETGRVEMNRAGTDKV